MLDKERNARLLLVVMFFILPLWMSWLNAPGTHSEPILIPVENLGEASRDLSQELVRGAKLIEYTVREGDNLGAIADQYHIDVDTIIGSNPDVDDLIQPGDKLMIPSERGVIYQVNLGDSLWRIAQVFGVDINTIRTANSLADDQIVENERLFLPGAKPARLAMAPSRRSATRFVWPTDGEISSRYGYRWGNMHSGVDIANDTGTQIRAAADGRVSYTGWYGGYGYAVIVEHGNGFSTLYGHLNGFFVRPGDYVSRGEVIAAMGSTGYSTGPHLHFEIRKDGEPVNPLGYLP